MQHTHFQVFYPQVFLPLSSFDLAPFRILKSRFSRNELVRGVIQIPFMSIQLFNTSFLFPSRASPIFVIVLFISFPFFLRFFHFLLSIILSCAYYK